MRIAVLEDEPTQMSHLVETLENCLFNNADEPVSCVPFHSGEALRSALRTESFDLLVLDWNVPDLDGFQLLAWLRKQRESTVPVVMLSGSSKPADHRPRRSTGQSSLQPGAGASPCKHGTRLPENVWPSGAHAGRLERCA